MMTQLPQQIFFDLDHTLWDYESNSKETIQELVEDYQTHFGRRIGFEDVYPVYSKVNAVHWDQYRKNEIDSETLRISRWTTTFSKLGIDRGDWMERLSVDFIQNCPLKKQLMPGAEAVLDKLATVYPMHMITNGLIDVQKIKIAQSGLDKYFGTMTTPETSGVKKPNPKIFHEALQLANCPAEHALYIGDSYAEDVQGGHNVGMQVIYFNPENRANPDGFNEIQGLSELLPFLGLI